MDVRTYKVPVLHGGTLNSHRAASPLVRTRRHGITPLRVKGDIEDASSELDNGGYRLHFLEETPRTLLLSAS
ncbi:hypothetical protein TNCV_870331 [Trichonephila clavipes]|nr:hypothetical protein TNCV_870331 [Trichonephila clavipes]